MDVWGYANANTKDSVHYRRRHGAGQVGDTDTGQSPTMNNERWHETRIAGDKRTRVVAD
jgi:hypothetical protein